jgi:hypothetical protein
MKTEQVKVVKIKDVYGVFSDMAAKALTGFTGIVSYENDGTSKKAQVHYLNGKFHREDGPAVEDVDYNCAYFLNGEPLTEEVWRVKVGKVNKPQKSKMKTNKEMLHVLRASIEGLDQKVSEYIEKAASDFEVGMTKDHIIKIHVDADLCLELEVPNAYASRVADTFKSKFKELGYRAEKYLGPDDSGYSYIVAAAVDFSGVEEELMP